MGGRGRQISEFKVSLVYKVSSRTEKKGSRVEGRPRFYSEFEASLGYMRPYCLKKKKKKKRKKEKELKQLEMPAHSRRHQQGKGSLRHGKWLSICQ